MTLSPASVRNVMADLEQLGLIYAPHTSAGRLPTELGLRFFVDALMEIGDLSETSAGDRGAGQGRRHRQVGRARADRGERVLSGLSRGAGVVLAAKVNVRLKHIEFVRLEPSGRWSCWSREDGEVENRVVDLPPGCRARR